MSSSEMSKMLLFLLASVSQMVNSCRIAVYEWKQIDFSFPDKATRANFIQKNTFPMDAGFSVKDPKRRMFVTTPKFHKGVPASLSIAESREKNSRLVPYPSWDDHSDTDCSKIISVMRFQITDCGHLWVIDTGVVKGMGTSLCPPKLLVYDLKTDQEIWRYQIPENSYNSTSSLLGTVIVNGPCGSEYAYIADIGAFGIVVVDRARSRSWRAENELMKYESDSVEFHESGENYNLTDGVVSLTSDSELLYFHSLSGRKEHSVPLSVINDEENFKVKNNTKGFYTFPGRRSGQSGPEALARGGDLMIFSNIPENALYCWKTSSDFSTEPYRVYTDATKLKFATGLKVVHDRVGKEYVLVTTSPFGKIVHGNLNVEEINYRILKFPVDRLVETTKCD